jgi:hypothetical protein
MAEKPLLLQPAVTLLQETMTTWAILHFDRDPNIIFERDVVNKTFKVVAEKIPDHKILGNEKEVDHVKELRKEAFFEPLKTPFDKLSKLRNDLNHAGFRPNPKPSDRFEENLHGILTEVLQKWKQYSQKNK